MVKSSIESMGASWEAMKLETVVNIEVARRSLQTWSAH